MSKIIIGLTGPMGAGKGEIVKILEKEGFKYVRLSDMIREEAKKQGKKEEREILMEIGNAMRKEEGTGVLAKKSLEKIMASSEDKWVIDGIRNPAEIDELRKEKGVFIIGVTSDFDTIVNRIISRARVDDTPDKNEILRKLKREWGEGERADGQQVGKCMGMVDCTITNEGTLDELQDSFMEFYSSNIIRNIYKNIKNIYIK